jgi:hypothetical protein
MGIRMYNTMRAAAKDIRADYEKTTATWDHKPHFSTEIRFSGANPRLTVGTNNEIYGDIDEGTTIRYDVMTHDPLFQPKTKVRFIGSVEGEGGFAYTDMENPRPGIDARMFSDTITKRHAGLTQDLLRDALIASIRRRGKKISIRFRR